MSAVQFRARGRSCRRQGGTALALSSVVLVLIAGCSSAPHRPGTGSPANEPWVRTELYFGLQRPGGGAVTETQWTDFLNQSVTPRFPDGLTIVQGQGRYRSRDQQVREEATNLLIILHPRQAFAASDRKIQDLSSEYIRRFDQESVLRSDSVTWTSFITTPREGVVRQVPVLDKASRQLSK